MWKTTILKLSSYPLSWRQYRFCKTDFTPTNPHWLLLPLFLRTSHLRGNLVVCKVSASQLVRVVLGLCSGAIRRESSPLVYQLNFFLCAHFIQVFPGSRSICFVVWLPRCLLALLKMHFSLLFFQWPLKWDSRKLDINLHVQTENSSF